ncbi:tyrosine--tRNA ligase [Neoehrlichia mikurensis]|uniref:tyrosine--tRNA ligase n=1 Tax=Neoehrlichia mikurensis TaxID=89586 RepID=UPI001C4750CF|nr:tyrosine--tRNA ligase [Neoehrlichia mikurensis]QXK93970.1 tyrosine--tRNA ligase [Neoehrlichia mikurensis]
MKVKSDFLNLLCARGYLYQSTNLLGLDQLMQSQKIHAYVGFDCTARSLHIGSLIQIMVLRFLQKCGHTPIILLGGATTKVGDPSGKDKTRIMISPSEILSNIQSIRKVIKKFIDCDSSERTSAIIVDNSEWLDNLNYIEFLRDIGSRFSVNVMMNFENVKARLERKQNLSFLEFNYMLLQAYDFIELHKRYNCILQIGGSDQWGNIVSGVDLGRKLKLPELFGITTCLLLTSSGKKMGKTATGAVWLDEELYDPYDYWQYFRNVNDEDVGCFLRFFTELSDDEIKDLEDLKGQEINKVKKILATEATKICHGTDIANYVSNSAINIFEHNDDSLLPVMYISREDISSGISIGKLLQLCDIGKSNSQVRKLISNRGCKINGVVVEDYNKILSIDQFDLKGYVKLSFGKKRHLKIVIRD